MCPLLTVLSAQNGLMCFVELCMDVYCGTDNIVRRRYDVFSI